MIIFFGPQGSGKGTQAELLATKNGWSWLSTGQILRDSPDPEIHRRQEAGELIDDALTAEALKSALESTKHSPQIILDGFPRNLHQAKWLLKTLPGLDQTLDGMVELDVPTDESIQRLLRRERADDNPAAVKRRLEIYHQETKPILEFYRHQGVSYWKVNGVGPVADIYERIRKALETWSPK